MTYWCNAVVSKFVDKWYTGVITIDDIPESKKEVKIKSPDRLVEDEIIWGWELIHGKQKLFLPDTMKINGVDENTLEMLPIKINEVEEFSFEKVVYVRATSISTFRIKPELCIKPEELFEAFCDIKHSSPDEYKTLAVIGLGNLIYRFNWRIASCAGFGKDGLFDTLGYLIDGSHLYVPNSPSKLMRKCHESYSVQFNEWMNKTKTKKLEFEEFFKDAGARKMYIENPSHSSKAYGTLDRYDISKLSLGIIYNEYKYYVESNTGKRPNDFFDFVYDHATLTRFFPLLLNKGQINAGQFEMTDNEAEELFNKYEKFFIKVVKTINYLIQNPDEQLKNKLSWTWKNNKFSTIEDQRVKYNLVNIHKACKLFAHNEEEYNKLADNVWNSYVRYLKQLNYSDVQEPSTTQTTLNL
jgi:hypothetical protein